MPTTRRFATLALCSSLAVAATGCRQLDPVPADADGAAAWLYEHQHDGEAAAVVEAVDNLRVALDLVALEEPSEGLLAPLHAEAVTVVGRTPVSTLSEGERAAIDEADLDAGTYVVLEDQQGMIVASTIPCPLDEVVGIHVRRDQDVIHGGYDAYERVYTSDAEAWRAGVVDTLSWSTDYEVSVLGASYAANILGQIRWVEPEGGPRIAVGRAWLPEPGTFLSGGQYFRQDYHLDVFHPQGAGETLHVFAVWRDLKISGFHSSNPAFISTVSSRFLESDEEIAALCAE